MDNTTSTLVCTQDETVSKGGLVFIEDSQGYHSVGNPSHTTPAITLHLYSPPFQKCKIWLGECHKPTPSSFCNDTEYGRKV
jgi:cysteine dioxygenase